MLGWTAGTDVKLGLYDGTWKTFGATPSLNEWHYLTYVVNGDGQRMVLYVDGQRLGGVLDYVPRMLGGTTTIGARFSKDGQYFPGMIDELRIDRTVRPADWVAATYLNMADNGTFQSYGLPTPVATSGVLLVTGTPVGYGVADPAYGFTTGWPAGTNFVASVNAAWTDETGGFRAVAAGWNLYDVDPETMAEQQLGSGNGSSLSYTNNGIGHIEWLFTEQYRVLAGARAGGSISTNGGWYDAGMSLGITATAESDAGFSHWSGDVPEEYVYDPSITLVIDQPYNIMANFNGTVWQAGLRGGSVSGYQNYDDDPAVTYIKMGPHIVTNRVDELIPKNTTWVYKGQIYFNGEPYRFAYNMNAYVYLRIDGVVYLDAGHGNRSTAEITLPAGWYDFDLRVSRASSTGLPRATNNWPLDLGFGISIDPNNAST